MRYGRNLRYGHDSRDAYTRLPFRSDRLRRASWTGGGLTFLDIAARTANVETVAGFLREVPLDVVGRAEWVVARWGAEDQDWPPAQSAADALQRRLAAIGSNAQLGVVPFEVGAKPEIVWSSSTSESGDHDRVLLARARAAEVDAFLRWGHALWLPDSYHYVLPSGKHTAFFVRFSDVFQDRRAASALATWLYAFLDSNTPTTVVMDIGTLMPLVSQLEIAAERHRIANSGSSARVGPVLALDRYPSNSLGLQTSLLSTPKHSPVLGLVSVSDSGGFAERLLSGLSALQAPGIRIEQLISRQPPGATTITKEPITSRTIQDPWLSLNESGLDGLDDDRCELCRDSERARLVRINPRAMSAMVLPEPDLVVPDIFDARRNATIWEVYGGADDDNEGSVILLEESRVDRGENIHRSAERVVSFEATHLVKEGSSALIDNRLAEFEAFPKRDSKDHARRRIQATIKLVADHASIVIYEKQERARFRDVEWQDFQDALIEHDFVREQAEWIGYTASDGLESRVQLPETDSPGVLIVALGSRLGLACQRMFLAGRQRWPSGNFRGLVVHAYPDDERVWASMRNTFRDSNGRSRLLGLWLTHLPNWSPLAVELDTYLAARERGFESPEMTRRLAELQAGPLAGNTLLGRPSPELQRHSYFGQQLGSRETLCAVGSAMQSARAMARSPGAPNWTQFDLRRVLRSYYDGLIHACVLRWCEPQEAWWGPARNDCSDFILELETVDLDFELLLPELLLASAQEKLPEEAMAQLVVIAQGRLTHNIDSRTRDHLQLGIDLCGLALDRPNGM